MSNEKIARLLLYRDKELVRKFAITRGLHSPVSIGRQGFGAIIDLPETYISRRHADIQLIDEQYLLLRDLNSAGGTFVNGQRIKEKRLVHQDRITFGIPDDTFCMVLDVVGADSSDTFSETSGMLSSSLVFSENGRTPTVPMGMEIKGGKDRTDIAALLETKSEIIIGRSKECDIMLPQLNITRQHALIAKMADGSYVIRDLGSKNGTFVNGKRIEEATSIGEHDDILIGAYKFRLRRPAEDIRGGEMSIVAEGLTRKVNGGKTTILRNLSFKIAARELVAIMGPSGCGKSTLLRALNGDAPATQGNVYIHGLELYDNYEYLKRLIGYVPQDDIVHRELTVEKSLFYAAKLRLSSDVSNTDIWQKIDEVLKNLNIGDPEVRQRKVGDLSGGQRKRVSIAVELLTDPSVLFLDEPTSPLDPETIEDFLLCLQKLANKGTTVLMVTHKPDDLYYVHKVVFLSKGGYLTFYGTKDQYLSFFSAKNVIEVYAKNGTLAQGEAWAARYMAQYPVSGIVTQTAQIPDKRRSDSFFKQLFWLTLRYFNIKTNDRANTTILLAQAPIIASLLALIFSELELSVLFFTTISAIWFGTNNAAKEIVGEAAVYKRERMFNLRILPYLLSKIGVLTFFSFLQVLVFIFIVSSFVGSDAVRFHSYWTNVGVMLYLSFSATLLGLMVSAWVSNTEKVMSIIPIVLIPQIMLAGVIASIPEESVMEGASYLMLSRWGTESFAYVQDSIRSYMADPLCPGELTYHTVDAVEFMNLPNSFDLPQKMETNLWAMGILNLFSFLGAYWGLRAKDNL